jgi:hypothetical protein
MEAEQGDEEEEEEFPNQRAVEIVGGIDQQDALEAAREALGYYKVEGDEEETWRAWLTGRGCICSLLEPTYLMLG